MEPTLEDFQRDRSRRFGTTNPERIVSPFWEWMVREGHSGYSGSKHFNLGLDTSSPVWCFRRFGSTRTPLPDGRTICVAGEHEDWYDSDFCIYNDVIVLSPEGQVSIYAYPERDFAPTDFHSATLHKDRIVLIGSLGYAKQRLPGHTQCYLLDTQTFRIEQMPTEGENPGWLSRHKSWFDERTGTVTVTGGSEILEKGSRSHTDAHRLDIASRKWTRLAETFAPRSFWLQPLESPERCFVRGLANELRIESVQHQVVGIAFWMDSTTRRLRIDGYELEVTGGDDDLVRVLADPRIPPETIGLVLGDLQKKLEALFCVPYSGTEADEPLARK